MHQATLILVIAFTLLGCSTFGSDTTSTSGQLLQKPTVQVPTAPPTASSPRQATEDEREKLQDILKRALDQQFRQFKNAKLPTPAAQQTAAYRETLEKILLAEGYYAHTLAQKKPDDPNDISKHGQGGKQPHARVNPKGQDWIVYSGPRYKIGSISAQPEPADFELRSAFPRSLHLFAPLRAETILAAEKSLETALDTHRCLWRIDANYDIALDHATGRADLTYLISPSPAAKYGKIDISGVTEVPESYLASQLSLETGDCFKRSAIRKARLALLNTGLISQVNATLRHDPAQGVVDVTFNVRERRHRSIRASIGYNIDEKGAISAGWTHRNFRQKANRLALSGRYSRLLQTANLHWTQSQVWGPKQNLQWELEAENETIDAFDAQNRLLALRSEHELRPHLLANIGLRLSRSEVIEQNIGKRFEFLAIPMGITYDRRDDLLDTQQGWLGFLETATFLNLRSSGETFQKLSLGLHRYVSYTLDDRTLTLATRVFLAGFTHKNTDRIPATEKYFAGGGGSVRGFPYKSLVPQGTTAISVDGGLSTLELSAELRYRINRHWGAVLFMDAGNAWAERTPDLTESLPQAAGFGVRFFTGFVPIRFDLAFPTNKPENYTATQAEGYQLYISIGQAF